MTDVLASVSLLLGVGLMAVAALGMVRLPDVFCRAHALGMATALGLGLVLAAVWLAVDSPGVGFKVFLAIGLQFATIPVASHLFGLLALRKGVRRWTGDGWRRDC
jgi:multicomponent Na+:H+ antiporter subunit G